MAATREVILCVGAEGGAITLYGERRHQGWMFFRHLLDQSAALLDEPTTEHQSDFVPAWEEAIQLMDEYPWHKLLPLEVHPDFREPVLREVLRRHAQSPIKAMRLDDWKDKCRKSAADKA